VAALRFSEKQLTKTTSCGCRARSRESAKESKVSAQAWETKVEAFKGKCGACLAFTIKA